MTAPILPLLEALPKARQVRPGAWVACCPAHEDTSPSLSWTTNGEGNVGIKCFADCSAEAIVAALGEPMSALFEPSPTNGHVTINLAKPKAGAVTRTRQFQATDTSGRVWSHTRHEDATGRAVGEMKWQPGVKLATLLPYGVESVASWAPEDPVFLVEGEATAEALRDSGLPALGTFGVQYKPEPDALAALAGRRVLLWPDADEVGRRHMLDMARRLDGIAAAVRWIEPPADVFKGWDAADADPETVARLVGQAAAVPKVSAQTPQGEWAETPGADSFVSAQTPPSIRAERNGLRFVTARELAAMTPERPEFAAYGLAFGATSELVGKVKVGKTDLVLAMVGAIVTGEPFLGQPTTKAGIVYLTEQPAASFRASLARADLLDADNLTILPWTTTGRYSWADVAAAGIAECLARGARVLIVDTLSRFAGIRGDGENSAGEADAATAHLQDAAAAGLAVLAIRHERKGGGEVGDSGRGSSAFTGAVDIALALRRGEGNSRPTVRVLHGLSRFDGLPETLVIERTDEGYVALGDETAVALGEAREAIRDLLPVSGPGLTADELREAVKAPRSTVQRALDDLVIRGDATRNGAGKRGDPFRFLSAQPIGEVWAETNRTPTPLRPGLSLADEMAEVFER